MYSPAYIFSKRRFRVVLDLEIMDDSHPEEFNWENMIDIGANESVSLVSVEEKEECNW